MAASVTVAVLFCRHRAKREADELPSAKPRPSGDGGVRRTSLDLCLGEQAVGGLEQAYPRAVLSCAADLWLGTALLSEISAPAAPWPVRAIYSRRAPCSRRIV